MRIPNLLRNLTSSTPGWADFWLGAASGAIYFSRGVIYNQLKENQLLNNLTFANQLLTTSFAFVLRAVAPMLMNIDIDEGVDPRKQLLLERRAMVLTMIIDCFKIAGLVCAAAAYAVLQNDENRQQATNPTLVDMATTLLAGYLASMTLSILPSAVLYVNAARKQTAEYADFAEFGFFLTPPSGFRFSTIEAPIELAALPNAAPASAQLYRPASQIALAA